MSHRGIEKEVIFFLNKILFGYLIVSTKLDVKERFLF